MKNQSINVKDMITIALIAALYVALTLVVPAVSYGPIQFRISELMNFLIVYKRKYAIGVIIGVLIANFFSPYFLDIFFGTGHTIIAFLICLVLFKVITNKKMQYGIVAFVFSALMFIIAYEIALLEGDMSLFLGLYGSLFLSEIVILVIGAPIMYFVQNQLEKYENRAVAQPQQH